MSDKPVLFLLPGLMCDEAVWVHQKEILSPYAEIIIPVFRGFDSLVDMGKHVVQQAPERFSVAGHSMGGRVAWEIMELAGNRIDKFAVMDSGVHAVKGNEQEKRQALLDKAVAQGLQAVADSWIPPMVHPDRQSDKVLIKEINAMILRNSVDDFIGQMHALLNRKDQTENVKNIKQQVLLLTGDADSHSPPDQHRFMADLIDNSRLEIVKDSGHMVTMEKPQEVSSSLLDWFTGNENKND